MAKLIVGENDLTTVNPELAAEWDYGRNDDLKPTDVTRSTGRKVWWKHYLPDGTVHEWQATIASRNAGNGCPYCSNQRVLLGLNDLATVSPQLASQWDCERNGSLKPTDVITGSNWKVWWKCPICGGSWKATVASRTAGSGCPFCSNRRVLQDYNDLATTHPKIAAEWNYERNGELLPEQFTYGSERQVWWRCPKCGHEWKTSINNRTNGAFATGCPKCGSEYGTSFPEQALLFYVRKYIDTDAKSRFKANLAGKTEELDIWIPSLRAGIEYDGEFFHAKRTKKDREKDEAAARANIRLIRIIECGKNDAVNDRIFIDVHKGKKENIERAISHVISTLAKRDIELDIDADTPEIMSLYKKSIEERSLKVENPELAAEWNCERNGRLKPENVSYGSTRKVWWKCPKGHEWIAAVNSRTNPKLKSGCPYCSNKKALAGYNDLATANPILAAEWDFKRNGELRPSDVTPGSCKKVWWKCPKCNSSYEASVANRSNGRGCPICCGKKIAVGINDLAAANPLLAAEWDFKRNGDLKPADVTAGSHRKVWWQGACGHEWQASVANRGRGSGCPYCGSRKVLVGYNDLATTNPEVAAEWDYDRNGDLIPENVMPKSGKKVWWKCSRCGNEWLTAVNVRTAGHICPHCAHTINQRR